MVTVSSLAALALDAPDNGAAILAVIDARMGEVYAGCFARNAGRLIVAISEESVGSADQIELPPAAAWNVIGSGWNAHRDALAARLPAPPHWSDGECYPQAQAVARLAAPIVLAGGGVAAEDALPVYLRDKVALTTEEQSRRP